MTSSEPIDKSNLLNYEKEMYSQFPIKPIDGCVRTDFSISSVTSRDLDFCIKVVLKEAVKEDKLVKQIFLTMLSAYTYKPINLSINAPSGEGKTHVLTKVASLFPIKDVIYVTDMSRKAIFHKSGYLAIRNEDGMYVNIEDELEQLTQDFENLEKELKDIDLDNKVKIQEIRKKLNEIGKKEMR